MENDNKQHKLMNTYSKSVPNVFLAKCTEKHEKGETIQIETKYGKEQNFKEPQNKQLNIAGVMRRLSDFKYRFWNEKRKKMSGVWTYKGCPFLGKGYVMEWVGMNDIEDTMVFEGDIFKNVDTGEYCVVRKYKGKFITDYGSTEHFGKWNHKRFDVAHTIGNLYLICGNIFQNANLVSDLIFVDGDD